MNFPLHLPFNDVHDFLVESVLLGNGLSHLKAYLPSEVYQYTFWKWAIQHLEEMSANEPEARMAYRPLEGSQLT